MSERARPERQRLLDLGPHDEPESDRQRDEQPGDAGDGDVGPLLTGQGLVEDEQAALGELDVDPGLQVVEPLLAARRAGRRSWAART